jgi:uncharacterized protein with PIN domain
MTTLSDQLAAAREEWIRQAIKQVVDERKQRNTKRCPQCHATLNKHTCRRGARSAAMKRSDMTISN